MKDAKALFLSLTFLTLPSLGQDESVTFVYPQDGDHELLVATRFVEPGDCRKIGSETTTYRVFGDGRFEIEPEPSWMAGERLVLEPQFVSDLLHSVDAILDLGAHHQDHWDTDLPANGSYIAVRLDRYTSPDHAIYLLDARMIDGLDLIFDDLRLLEKWAALHPGRVMWRSGPSWPLSCYQDRREKLGHRVLKPAWCGPPAFRKPESSLEGSPFGGNDNERARRVQERLRERLRSLPRGPQLEVDAETPRDEDASPCRGAGHSHGVELSSQSLPR